MQPIKTILLVLGFLLAAAFLLPLAIGIWLPDIFFAPTRTLAHVRLTNGYSFHVIQKWANGYSTVLYITGADGFTNVWVLDVDDSKHWSAPMTIDSTNRLVSVSLGRDRIKNLAY